MAEFVLGAVPALMPMCCRVPFTLAALVWLPLGLA